MPKILLSQTDNIPFNHDDITKLAKEMSLLDVDSLSAGKIHSFPQKSYIPKELNKCDYVWLRVDRVRRPLEAPYTGPFKVLRRSDKHFTIELSDKSHSTVSIDRLKPSSVPSKDNVLVKSNHKNAPEVNETLIPNSSPNNETDDCNLPQPEPICSRSGRRIKFSKDNSYHYF